ncbi:MAG: DUF2802 domain-containing protein [Desulfobacterales bacterium]|nr:DUF2802 domain-containing protein [Desulfobacterales bacterium]
MSYAVLQYLETALDVVGLLMCMATLIYIIRIRLAGRRKSALPKPGDFKKEMRSQTENQTAENALETIARALDQERKNLQLYLGTGLQPVLEGGASNSDRSFTLPDKAAPVYQAGRRSRRKSGVYSEALELAACGLSTSQIADKVHLPKGEVELSIKLRHRRKKNR